MDLIIQSSFN